MKKHLFLATAVLAAPLLAHADLKAMDDGALSDVTGRQASAFPVLSRAPSGP